MKNMKQVLALILVICLLLSCVAYATPGTEGDQAAEELSYFEGVLGQTTFTICPQKHVNCSFIQFQLDKSVSSRINVIL